MKTIEDIKNLFTSDDEKSRRRKRNIGLTLLGLSLGGQAAFVGRGLFRRFKFKNLLKDDALKSTKAVDSYVRRHLSKNNIKLPGYRWSNLSDIKRTGRLGTGGPLTSEAIPVYTSTKDLMEGIDHTYKGNWLNKLIAKFMRRQGAHFDTTAKYVFLGENLNPKTLLHELGHAQDVVNGKFLPGDRSIMPKSIRAWLNAIRNPDSTGLLQQEIRAWENGGIKAGDKVREAALDTYRNAVQQKMMAPVFGALQLPGGYMYFKNREPKKKK